MAEKRRDNKGRILRTGESQRKDGRYAYKYTDSTGKPQFVYAWKLVANGMIFLCVRRKRRSTGILRTASTLWAKK